MWKGCATAAATASGLFGSLLAREGMTGPDDAFEGRYGIWNQVTGPFDLTAEGLGRGGGSPMAIERTSLKFFPSQYDSQALLWMALQLRQQVRVEEIERVHVQIYRTAFRAIGSEPEKWDPQTRETADHSLPYRLAVALREGALTPASFDLERIQDPSLRSLMPESRSARTRNFPSASLRR